MLNNKKCKTYFRIALFLVVLTLTMIFTITRNIPFWVDITLLISVSALFCIMFEKDGRKYFNKEILFAIVIPMLFNTILLWISGGNMLAALLFTSCAILAAELCNTYQKGVKIKVIIARLVSLGISLYLSWVATTNGAVEFSNLINCDISFVQAAIAFHAYTIQMLFEIALRYAKKEWKETDNYMYIGVYLLPLVYIGYLLAGPYGIFIKLALPVYCVLFKGGKFTDNLKSVPSKLLNSVIGAGIEPFKFSDRFDKKVIQKSWSDLIKFVIAMVNFIKYNIELAKRKIMKVTVNISYNENVVDRYQYPTTNNFNWKVFCTWDYLKLQKFMV